MGRLAEGAARALALIGGLGLLLAIAATWWSALAKVALRQFNALWGPQDVPAVLQWIRPLAGEDEVVGFAVAFALFAALPFVAQQRGHIRIDLLAPRFGPKLNRILDLIADGLLLLLALLFLRQKWNLIFRPARVRSGQDPLLDLIWQGDWAEIWGQRFLDAKQTQVMGLPFWPLHIWAQLCVALFVCVAALSFLRSVQALRAARS